VRISEILNSKGSEVIVIKATATVAELVTLLRDHHLGAAVVSGGHRAVDGIISERDVVRRLADGTAFLSAPVSSIMTADVHTCSPSDSIQSVMETMTEQRVRHLPVVDDHGRLAGIVSIGDVVKWTISELRFERDQLEDYVYR
jgi:CBS domain-containing protein